MTFEQYVAGIRFRYLQPDMPLEPLWNTIVGMPVPFEFLNTDLPDDELETKVALMSVYGIRKMSTLAMGAIIRRAVADMPEDQVFLNVGVLHGYSLLCGMTGHPDKFCIGVDNFSEFGGPREAFMRSFDRVRSERHSFFESDYREYLRSVHQGKLGFYFYDGPHAYEDQLLGLQLAEPFFAENCLVMVDDTNWDEARRGTADFIAGSAHRYRIVLDARTCENMHPTFWNGVMILRRE